MFNWKLRGSGFFQSDGLAMGASLAVILAKVWMNSFEKSPQRPELSENKSKSDQNRNCKDQEESDFPRKKNRIWVMQKLVSSKVPKKTNKEYAKTQFVV